MTEYYAARRTKDGTIERVSEHIILDGAANNCKKSSGSENFRSRPWISGMFILVVKDGKERIIEKDEYQTNKRDEDWKLHNVQKLSNKYYKDHRRSTDVNVL